MLPNLALTYRFIVAYPALQSCYKVYKCLSQRRWPRAKTSTPFQKTNEYLTINLFIVRPNYNLVYSAYYKLVYSGTTITLFIVATITLFIVVTITLFIVRSYCFRVWAKTPPYLDERKLVVRRGLGYAPTPFLNSSQAHLMRQF